MEHKDKTNIRSNRINIADLEVEVKMIISNIGLAETSKQDIKDDLVDLLNKFEFCKKSIEKDKNDLKQSISMLIDMTK